MTIRMHADKRGIPVTRVSTTVLADRTQPGKTTFKYSFVIAGALTNEQGEELKRVAESCPVRKTLSNQIEFVSKSE
jgi:putative redox protein